LTFSIKAAFTAIWIGGLFYGGLVQNLILSGVCGASGLGFVFAVLAALVVYKSIAPLNNAQLTSELAA
jgi:hypothetical protein